MSEKAKNKIIEGLKDAVRDARLMAERETLRAEVERQDREIERLRDDNARLRAAIRETLYMDDSGHVACQFYPSQNLADIAPVLTEVLAK